MEGVGARLGRSSTRYGPATVFSGPVRKWKKRWVHVSPSNNNNNNNNNSSNLSQNHNHNNQNQNQNQNHHHSINATTSNGSNSSHLLLYRWTPLTHSSNKDGTSSANGDDGKLSIKENGDRTPLPEEPPRRKFKYFPVYLLEKEKYEAGEESKESDAEPTTVEQTPKGDGDLDEKPDINDTPMEETQAAQDDNQVVRQDLNESTLDLSLGLNSHDDDSDAKPDQSIDGQLDRVNSSSAGT